MMKLITTDELCEVLKVSRITIYKWRKKGLPFIKVGRTIRFDLDDVLKWLKAK